MTNQETCLVLCEKCGRTLTAVWNPGGLFGGKKGWDVPACPGCSEARKGIEIETVVCPHCGARMEKGSHQTCLACGNILIKPASLDTVQCPNCKLEVFIPAIHRGSFICNHCKYEIPESYIKTARPIAAPEPGAQYIRLPDTREMLEKRMVIWKHPVSVFPFKSRIQVNEGTYALMYQNGVCQYPLGPGSYPLEESNLSREQRFDVAMARDEDSVVFHTDIYCVLKNLPEVVWGIVTPEITRDSEAESAPSLLETPAFENMDRNAVFTVRSNGRLVYAVCDPKAFMDFVGNRAVSEDDLLSPGTEDGGAGLLLAMTRKEINAAMYACVRAMAAAENVDLARLKLRQPEVIQALIREMDSRVLSYGLCVYSLDLTAFSPEETEASVKNRKKLERIQQMVEENVSWTKNVVLHAAGSGSISAQFTFSGVCRIAVSDKAAFLRQGEIKQYLSSQDSGEIAMNAVMQQKCDAILANQLPQVLQSMIDQGRIADFLLPDLYAQAADALKEAVNQYLVLDGMRVVAFMLNVPVIDPASYSPELKAKLFMEEQDKRFSREEEERKRKLELYIVQDQLALSTQPIRVHMKDDATIDVTAQFSGKCQLRVRDRDVFFASPEAQGFLRADPFVTPSAVADHYKAKLTPPFNSILSMIVQAVVDQTNADVTELNRMMGILQDSVIGSMNDRISRWGLMVESLDIDPPVYLHSSPNLQAWKLFHDTRTGADLANEMDRIKNDRVIFIAKENGRVQMAVDQTHTEAYKAAAAQKNDREEADAAYDVEAARRKHAEMERKYEEKLRGMEMARELDRLLDEAADAKKTRSLESIRREYQQKYIIMEESIQENIRQDQMRQQAKIDEAARAREAQFEDVLSKAENQRALNDIMHKIDQSDLDWRQKLDEYSRLHRQLNEQDFADFTRLRARAKADADWIGAETHSRVQREDNDAYYVVRSTRIKLAAQEADLLDSISRRAEELDEKSDAARQTLDERRASLSFEQKMREKAQQLSDDMQRVSQQFQQELALREKDDALAQKRLELDKLKYVFDYLTSAIQSREKIDIAQFDAEKEIKTAEAKYDAVKQTVIQQAEKQRAQDQLKREDSIAQNAAALNEKILEIQKALEMTRLMNERNADNQRAQQAIHHDDAERAKAERKSKEETSGTEELKKQMTTIVDSVSRLRARIASLEQADRAQAQRAASTQANGSATVSFDLLKQMVEIINSILERTVSANRPAQPAPQQPIRFRKQCAYCGEWNDVQATQCFHCHAPFIKP